MNATQPLDLARYWTPFSRFYLINISLVLVFLCYTKDDDTTA
jgi:hypothetical protein